MRRDPAIPTWDPRCIPGGIPTGIMEHPKSNPRLHGVTNSTVSVIHAHKMDPSQDHEGEYFSRWDKGSQVEYVNPE